MIRATYLRMLLIPVIVSGVLTIFGVSHATLMVQATVFPSGAGLFHYEVAITNNTAEDVVIVSVTDAPPSDIILENSLGAPAGFLASYDFGLGIVDFLEDTELFAKGDSVGGFSFDSPFGPAPDRFSIFEAFSTTGNFFTGGVETTVVPEPGTLFLLAVGMFLFSQRLRNRSSKARKGGLQ